jgi:hypothetical protein
MSARAIGVHQTAADLLHGTSRQRVIGRRMAAELSRILPLDPRYLLDQRTRRPATVSATSPAQTESMNAAWDDSTGRTTGFLGPLNQPVQVTDGLSTAHAAQLLFVAHGGPHWCPTVMSRSGETKGCFGACRLWRLETMESASPRCRQSNQDVCYEINALLNLLTNPCVMHKTS